MITVLPDGGARGWYTDWVRQDTAAGAQKWETFHIKQVIPLIDDNLRTINTKNGRAIGGLPMGGFGALSYTENHPALFSQTVSLSGAIDFTLYGSARRSAACCPTAGSPCRESWPGSAPAKARTTTTSSSSSPRSDRWSCGLRPGRTSCRSCRCSVRTAVGQRTPAGPPARQIGIPAQATLLPVIDINRRPQDLAGHAGPELTGRALLPSTVVHQGGLQPRPQTLFAFRAAGDARHAGREQGPGPGTYQQGRLPLGADVVARDVRQPAVRRRADAELLQGRAPVGQVQIVRHGQALGQRPPHRTGVRTHRHRYRHRIRGRSRTESSRGGGLGCGAAVFGLGAGRAAGTSAVAAGAAAGASSEASAVRGGSRRPGRRRRPGRARRSGILRRRRLAGRGGSSWRPCPASPPPPSGRPAPRRRGGAQCVGRPARGQLLLALGEFPLLARPPLLSGAS